MIDRVSESLRNLLEAQMAGSARVTLLSPADPSSHQNRVNLFLYRVVPNGSLRNRDWAPKPGAPGQLVHPPLYLSLFYLLTPYAPRDPQTGLADAHGLLAEAMRVLHEHAVVPQAHLESGLRQGEVKVILHPADVEELTKIWTALNKDYLLSAVYEVSVAEVRSTAERPTPGRVRRTRLEVEATDRRPRITGMAPRSGPAGTVIAFAGEGLAPWKVTVRVGPETVLRDRSPPGDSGFEAAVPGALLPGVYEVAVDVGGLAGFRGVFEVTP